MAKTSKYPKAADNVGKAPIFKEPPESCNCCGGTIGGTFYDASLPGVGWGDFCHSCFTSRGGTLGVGRGQKFKKLTAKDTGNKALIGKYHMVAGGTQGGPLAPEDLPSSEKPISSAELRAHNDRYLAEMGHPTTSVGDEFAQRAAANQAKVANVLTPDGGFTPEAEAAIDATDVNPGGDEGYDLTPPSPGPNTEPDNDWDGMA